MEYKKQVPEFNPKNNELYLLALKAAIDINNYKLGRGGEGDSVKYLSELLEGITRGKRPKIKRNRIISSILAHAIFGREDFKKYQEEKKDTADEILLQTNLVAKNLRDFKRLPYKKLGDLETFCANLSNELMLQEI